MPSWKPPLASLSTARLSWSAATWQATAMAAQYNSTRSFSSPLSRNSARAAHRSTRVTRAGGPRAERKFLFPGSSHTLHSQSSKTSPGTRRIPLARDSREWCSGGKEDRSMAEEAPQVRRTVLRQQEEAFSRQDCLQR